MDELWDVKAVARYLKLTERTVYEKARRGDLPALRVGNRWRFRPAEIEAWLGRAATTAAQAGPPPETPSDRRRLEAALDGVEEPLKRRLIFVALLTEACVARGWQPPVVVGGHALEVYTGGGYTTVDIDLVSMSEPLEDILGSWGFARSGRHWIDESLGLVVEAPGSRLGAGERAHLTSVRTEAGTAYLIGLEDLIIDRLNSCVHRGVEDDCGYAAALIGEHADRLDTTYLRTRAREERVADRLAAIEGSVT